LLQKSGANITIASESNSTWLQQAESLLVLARR
jgi:hypothetical protein